MSYEINQLYVAESFQAMYLNGSGRSTLSREELHARHELCEDLAQSLSEVCLGMQAKDEVGVSALIKQCHDGLVGSESGISPPEAGWVAIRIAELLQQDVPDFLRPAA